jgi:hypothetical protein
MRGLSTAALVAAWEDGMAEPAVDRAPALLRPLGLIETGCDPAAMTVGACDLLLLKLRGWLFGADLDLVATCPACRQAVELVIPGTDLVPAGPGAVGDGPGLPGGDALGPSASAGEAAGLAAAGPGAVVVPGEPRLVTVEEDGLRIRCRVPTNGDLRQLAGLGRPVTLADLLGRCVESMEGPKAPRAAAELPAPLAERVAERLAASDPGADISAEIECPCGTVWAESIDIRAILWTDLTRWVGRRLAEVHQLAAAYGWAERDILEMSPYRRHFYLEACAG